LHESISEFFNKKLEFAIYRPNRLRISNRNTQTAQMWDFLIKRIETIFNYNENTEDSCNVM